ncbi:MAG TPA: hypothetical protein VN256_16540 [Pyrinomonadaceae bacterium]|nr:hypothetical protein [Pyrinomonadaceae bacterium]
MSEDVTGRLPDRPDGLQELVRLVQSFRAELADLKQTVEARLHDTRPIWEKVLTDIAQLQEGQQRIEERIEALRDDTRTGLRNLKRDFGILNDTFLEVRGEYRDLDRRVYRLEEPQP